ncbi:MAG: PilN domain-containing protein [Patescibacteria group bacterium]|nr:PilN domain-containing protein [Patescibacteria group bacterium]
MTANINLVSPENENKPAMSGKAMLFLSIGLVVLTLAVYGAISFMGKNYSDKKASLESDIQVEKAKMSSPNYAALADFQDRIYLLGKIVDDHAYWDKYLKELSKYVLPEIRFSELSGGEKEDVFSIKGIASNFETLSRGIMLLQKFPGISSVEFKGASEKTDVNGSQSGIEFELTATADGKYLQGNSAEAR